MGRYSPPLVISIVIHAMVLIAAGFYKLPELLEEEQVAVETVFEERVQEQFEQELQVDTTVSQTLSATAGGMVTSAIGSAASTPISRQKVEASEILEDPKIKVTQLADISLPGLDQLGEDLGEGEVTGEVGARVEGYGAAMHRLTAELTRMMRQQQVIAVWMFDASNSLKDDRNEIRDNFHKIYEELDIARKQATVKNERFSALETMVCSFGKDVVPLLPKPTDDIKEIKAAIDRVKPDESGEENTFAAIDVMIEQYGKTAARSNRKLVVILLTDETGGDDQKLEDVVDKAKKYKSPVYFLGREAIFGYPYAQVRWVDPETKLPHWIRIDRGPETAFPECLQYDGFGGRWDSTSSGFGPYGQVRLVKHSGGIFFMLTSAEADLSGSAAQLQRKFDDLAMKEYEPILADRREYAKTRDASEFRRTVWNVIVDLNPHENFDPQLNIRRWHYPMGNAEFREVGQQQFERAVRAMGKLNRDIATLEKAAPLRAKEREPRWRAAYDLVYAQCLAIRVRDFQLLLALDRHGTTDPKPKDPKSNRWDIHLVRNLIEPSAEQIKATKVDLKELQAQQKKAVDAYNTVIAEHPNTPWALRAQQELGWGFGIAFADLFWDPRYDDPKYRDRVPKF